jgi:hypothetical protein
MPSPRPPGSGVDKILVLHKTSQDQVFHFVILSRYSSEPGGGFVLFCFLLEGRFFWFITSASSTIVGSSFPLGLSAIAS